MPSPRFVLMFFAVALWTTSCGNGQSGATKRDVRGNYALTYDDTLLLKLNVGGAVREVTAQGYGGIADFGTYNGQPVKLNLSEFCQRPEVRCPSETFWTQVAIDQQDVQRPLDLHVLNVIDNSVHDLPAGQHAQVVGGLVNHADAERFVVGLGLQGGANENCGALAISLAAGRFSLAGEKLETATRFLDANGKECLPTDGGAADAGAADGGAGGCRQVTSSRWVAPEGARVDGIKEGRVGLGWLGGCAFGPFLVGATLTLETGFVARRSGEFDPPPFTPVPASLPDGGFPDGGGADAGSGG